MDRISRIRNIIRWQDLCQEKKILVSAYESNEQNLTKLKSEYDQGQENKIKLSEFSNSLTNKITHEEEKLDHILTQIENMEKHRDNLKMFRQIKSWEKDMDRYAQDRAVIEAQFYYDKSKIGDIAQELENLEQTLTTLFSEIDTLEQEINAVKSETKAERDTIETEMKVISSEFDSHFAEYFERLLLKNKGIVMAEIENDSCSGCNILLPTSFHGGNTVQETEDSALMQCPNCFRYLYYTDDI